MHRLQSVVYKVDYLILRTQMDYTYSCTNKVNMAHILYRVCKAIF